MCAMQEKLRRSAIIFGGFSQSSRAALVLSLCGVPGALVGAFCMVLGELRNHPNLPIFTSHRLLCLGLKTRNLDTVRCGHSHGETRPASTALVGSCATCWCYGDWTNLRARVLVWRPGNLWRFSLGGRGFSPGVTLLY